MFLPVSVFQFHRPLNRLKVSVSLIQASISCNVNTDVDRLPQVPLYEFNIWISKWHCTCHSFINQGTLTAAAVIDHDDSFASGNHFSTSMITTHYPYVLHVMAHDMQHLSHDPIFVPNLSLSLLLYTALHPNTKTTATHIVNASNLHFTIYPIPTHIWANILKYH